MIVVGIDVGKSGAVSILGNGSITTSVMPDLHKLAAMFSFWKTYEQGVGPHVFVEKAQAMPKNGSVSMFNYGTGYGSILGVLVALGLRYSLVPPKVWTREMHLGAKAGHPKERSLEVCKRLFPDVCLLATPRCSKAHEGIVDSLLIAEWGRRHLGVVT